MLVATAVDLMQELVWTSCRDWLGKHEGHSGVALLPSSTDQVSKILSYCNKRTLAVVPQGGNTGLVVGSVPIRDEVVISMAAMSKIISFDKVRDLYTVIHPKFGGKMANIECAKNLYSCLPL